MDGGAWWATVHGVAKESDTTERLTSGINSVPQGLQQSQGVIKGAVMIWNFEIFRFEKYGKRYHILKKYPQRGLRQCSVIKTIKNVELIHKYSHQAA